jgi:predicted nucleic acid-binding protein
VTKLLLDTDVLIDHLRGDLHVAALLRDVAAGRVRASVSVITESELLASPRLSRAQIREIEALLALLPSLAVTSRVARVAAKLQRTERMALPDALIAATAMLAHATLVTRNLKHFRQLKSLHIRSV